MRFKDWLQNEISLNLADPTNQTPNPTQVNQASDSIAKDTLAKFGTDITNSIMQASSPKEALKKATEFAQKGLKQQTANPAKSPTNTAGVAGKIYTSITGQKAKTVS